MRLSLLTSITLRSGFRSAHVLGWTYAALTLGGCDAAGSGSPGVEVIRLPDGVTRVVNTGDGAWTEDTAWRAVEILRIGRAEGDGPELLAAPLSLETDPAGNLYVLDVQAMQVRAFGPDGRHLRSFGSSGAGPGELRQPVAIFRGPDATLWVYDPGNARFTVFDTLGAVRETRPRENTSNFSPWPGRIDNTGRLWDAASEGSAPMRTVLLWSEVAADGSGQARLPSFVPERFTGPAGQTQAAATVPFSPYLHWALDSQGRVWAGVSDRYRLVHFVPGGDTLRQVELEVEPIPVSAAERARAIEDLSWFTQQGGRVDAGRIPSRKPPFAEIRVDDRDYVWVTPALPAEETVSAFDVFDPEGIYQGRLTLPIALEPWSPVIVRGDRLYTAVLAPEGHPQVVVFQLEGRGGA